MSWFKRFHDDHRAVYLLLAKLEGNLLDLPHQGLHPNLVHELDEFVQVIDGEIMPHFKVEEEKVYPLAAERSPVERDFIEGMREEHRRLYAAFAAFRRALDDRDTEGVIKHGRAIVDGLREHIEKEETRVRAMLECAEERREPRS